MNLSPIVIFVYNRPWHTQQTIEALQKNELSSESEIFILKDNTMNNKKRNQALKHLKRDTSQFFQVHNRVILE